MDEPTNREVAADTVVPNECPFCGAFHARTLEFAPGAFYIRCRKCNGTGPLGPTRNIAALAWNTRPMVQSLRKALQDVPENTIQHWWEEAKEAASYLDGLTGQT